MLSDLFHFIVFSFSRCVGDNHGINDFQGCNPCDFMMVAFCGSEDFHGNIVKKERIKAGTGFKIKQKNLLQN